VREGGGIEPDVSLPDATPSEIETQLLEQDTYEIFASFWQRSHPLEAPPSKGLGLPSSVVMLPPGYPTMIIVFMIFFK
jgi:hypothetical protein